MIIELLEDHGGKVLTVRVADKLHKEDYEQFVPEIERLIKQHGKIRVLFDMYNFHGWTMGALWEDIKFDVKHFCDIQRLAMVGEKRWEKWMATFCRPFTTAQIRFFDKNNTEEAREWVHEGLPVVAERREGPHG